MLRRMLQILTVLCTVVLSMSLGMAQDIPDEYKECANAVAAAGRSDDGKAVGSSHNQMRNACAQFRTCKKRCAASKRECKAGARSDKRECKNGCRGLKGKAKRACKKNCRQGKKVDKRACRNAKRSCKNTCRSQFKTAACVSARRSFWKSVGAFAQAQAKGVANACQDAYPKN